MTDHGRDSDAFGGVAFTSLIFYIVARGRWNWSLAHVLLTFIFLAMRSLAAG